MQIAALCEPAVNTHTVYNELCLDLFWFVSNVRLSFISQVDYFLLSLLM